MRVKFLKNVVGAQHMAIHEAGEVDEIADELAAKLIERKLVKSLEPTKSPKDLPEKPKES